MNAPEDAAPTPRRFGPGAAFLLSQLGAHAADRFAERTAELDLTPPQTGLLRAIARDPGRSQQVIAAQLGILPSRLVTLLDVLEDRGLVQRRRNLADRRLYAVHLSAEGEQAMRRIAQAARSHDDAMLAGLNRAERAQLLDLLTRLAAEHRLTAGVHPGYRGLSAPEAADDAAHA